MAQIEMIEDAKAVGATNNAQGDENRVIQVVDNPQLENKNGTTDTILDKGGKRKKGYTGLIGAVHSRF